MLTDLSKMEALAEQFKTELAELVDGDDMAWTLAFAFMATDGLEQRVPQGEELMAALDAWAGMEVEI